MQNITIAVTAPIYFIIHLLTSPASSSNPTADDIFVDPVDAAVLFISTYLTFIMPAVSMGMPPGLFFSTGVHYTYIAIWQVFPITHTITYYLLRRLSPQTHNQHVPDEARAIIAHLKVARIQRFILCLCFIPRTIAMAIAVTPASLAPQVWKPLFDQVTLESLLVPLWPWNSPAAGDPTSPAGKPELAKLFLQWDMSCAGFGILAWAVFVYLVSLPHKDFLRNVWPTVLTYGVFGGPVAVATLLVMERDGFVLELSVRPKKA